MSRFGSLFTAFLLLISSLSATEALQPYGYVNDFASVISSPMQQRLEDRLRNISKLHGPEIAVVTINSTDGLPIEERARLLFDTWQIGKEGKDNGVLLLVAVDDRTLRIEVGYGIEPLLPDSQADRIIRHTIVPHFRNNDYSRGIERGVQAIIDHTMSPDIASQIKNEEITEPLYELMVGAVVLLSLLFFSISYSVTRKGRKGLSLLSFFLQLILISTFYDAASKGSYLFSIVYLAGFFTLLIFHIKYIFDRSGDNNDPYYGGGGGGWSSGRGWHVGSHSSGGGFGGFGGGRGGGGGASGRW
ncbi:MAG: TPM domain-containing protein [Chlamydiales bacterium]|nr:TPM domain-containing protein [Chlamydiia bacterium]MCP5507905.1 TPM domain-containing protein [Chlamydiales bacterium]